jgi:hypothetical protein
MAIPRSLADDLRQRDDAALARLLWSRPDLLHPVPSDVTALTTRSTTGPSVARCLDTLDALTLYVLSVCSDGTAEGPAAAGTLAEAAGRAMGTADPDALVACHSAVDVLYDLGLLWGGVGALRTVQAVRDLGLDHTPPAWPRPTLIPGSSRPLTEVDEQAALHARATVARVRELVDDWSLTPPAVLRSGGLSLRDFAGLARSLQADWPLASLTIELAHAARLVADDAEESPHWVPTDHADTWLARSPAEQWAELVESWLSLPRLAWVADEKTQVLSQARDRRAVPVLRRQVLELLVELPAGVVLDPVNAVAVLDDRQPRRGGDLRRQALHATLAEAVELGLLGAGALSTAGRVLLTTDAADASSRRARATAVADAMSAALPAEVDEVLIQADLTMVAPGPLTSGAARSLRLLADVESRGHATVFRISEDSIRRALDAGWDAATIQTTLAAMSRTPLPQPLTYLIDDVARRHGAVRVGAALSYLRCDNPETLVAAVGDRRLRSLALTRLADTVLVCQAPPSEVIATLRASGYAPAAESADGALVIRRPQERRIRAPRAAVTTRRVPEAALVQAAVRAVRAGDRAASRGAVVTGPAATTAAPSLSTTAIVGTLSAALADAMPIWIGYADNNGAVTQQIVDPIRLGGGVLTAFDHRTEQVRSFTVSRVTGVAALTGDDASA